MNAKIQHQQRPIMGKARRFTLTLRLLYKVIAIGFLCLFADVDDIGAAEASLNVVRNGMLNGSLAMQFQSDGVFNEKVVKFLNRGFTIRVDYKIELWRSRRYWFDSLDSQRLISYQINFEPLEKRYICLRSQEGMPITSRLDQELDKTIRWATQLESPLAIIPLEQMDTDAEYYYSIEVMIATLTTENVQDLQKWLREFGGKEKEPSTIAKTSFKVVTDFLSSRNNKEFSVQSEKFRLKDLPDLSDDASP